MSPRLLAFFNIFANPLVSIGGAVVIVVAAIGYAYYSVNVPLASSGVFVPVIESSISGSVGSTGVTESALSTDLSFLRSGQIARVDVSAGAHVHKGDVLVTLNHADLDAALLGAKANFEVMNAKLASLEAGTRPEQVTLDQTNITQAQSALRDTIRKSYVDADDAVHNKADQFFANARTTNATLNFTLPDASLVTQVQNERVALEPVLAAWATEIATISFATNDPTTDAQNAEVTVRQVNAFLDDVTKALAETPASASLPSATLSGYQTAIATARGTTATDLASLTTSLTALRDASGTLTLAQAGATTDDVRAAQAAADQASAAVAGIAVEISQASLVSPIDGTVTAQNAHLGQSVSPGITIISLAPDAGAKTTATVVPASAVFTDNGSAFVFVKDSAGKIAKTMVTTGIENDTQIEITSGLSAGQSVFTVSK